MVINRFGEHPFEPALNPFDGKSIQHPDKDTIFGDAAGFLEGLLRVIHKLKRCIQTGEVKRIVIKWEIAGKSAIQIDPVSQIFQRNIEHIGGWIEPGGLNADFKKRKNA